MSGHNGLKIAAELALKQRDQAVQVLAGVRQTLAGAQAQLDQLESYAQECNARWVVQSAECTPELMRHHYQFMARLDHAIGLQLHVISDLNRRVERETAAVRQAEGRLESLRQLMGEREREQQRLVDRREQKMSDEQAALQHRRRMNESLGGGLA